MCAIYPTIWLSTSSEFDWINQIFWKEKWLNEWKPFCGFRHRCLLFVVCVCDHLPNHYCYSCHQRGGKTNFHDRLFFLSLFDFDLCDFISFFVVVVIRSFCGYRIISTQVTHTNRSRKKNLLHSLIVFLCLFFFFPFPIQLLTQKSFVTHLSQSMNPHIHSYTHPFDIHFFTFTLSTCCECFFFFVILHVFFFPLVCLCMY